jgi:hypothetical protein
MPWLTLTPILIWALICVPVLVIFWFSNPAHRLMLFLVWFSYTLVNLYFFMTVNWALVNYYLRFMPLVFSLAVFLRWQRAWRNSPWFPPRSASSIASVAGILAFMAFPVYLLVGVYRSGDLSQVKIVPVLSLYPLRTGLYVVGNAGNNQHGWGMNSYSRDWLGLSTDRDSELVYAVDFMEMRTNGMIADHVLEKDVRNYEIFNELVYSPCLGEVVFVDGGRPIIPPYSVSSGPQDRLGNRLTIRCSGDYLITLANLRNINVAVGEQVSFNRMVGNVGNSASNSIPSLHVYATTLDGTPVPILFEAWQRFRFITRNFVFVRSP